jgi:hypothetical protein
MRSQPCLVFERPLDAGCRARPRAIRHTRCDEHERGRARMNIEDAAVPLADETWFTFLSTA